jgi:hypothetical protein
MAYYQFKDLIECVFLVVAHASNTLPPHLDRPFTESALAVVMDKLWSGDDMDKQTIYSAYEKWMGYRYEEPEDDFDDGDSESIRSE